MEGVGRGERPFGGLDAREPTPSFSSLSLSPQVVQYDPVPCKQCGAILNPYAAVDFGARAWACALCGARSALPPHYAGISDAHLPAELHPACTTIEYQTAPQSPIQPPAYVFVVDTAVGGDELAAARRALAAAVAALPDYARVALVTFGTHAAVHELGYPDLAKSYVFAGAKEHAPGAVAAQLGLGPGPRAAAPRAGAPGAPPPPAPPGGGARFVVPLAECEFALNAALDDLARDAFPTLADARPARCTGTALTVAAALAAAALPPGSCACRIMLFVGGPSTDGGGAVVGRPLAEPIRSHKDVAKDAAPHHAKALKFYEGLAGALVAAGHALDVFACSLDQVGRGVGAGGGPAARGRPRRGGGGPPRRPPRAAPGPPPPPAPPPRPARASKPAHPPPTPPPLAPVSRSASPR